MDRFGNQLNNNSRSLIPRRDRRRDRPSWTIPRSLITPYFRRWFALPAFSVSFVVGGCYGLRHVSLCFRVWNMLYSWNKRKWRFLIPSWFMRSQSVQGSDKVGIITGTVSIDKLRGCISYRILLNKQCVQLNETFSAICKISNCCNILFF